MGVPFTSDQFFGVFAEYNRSFWFVALALWFVSAAVLAGAWRNPRRWSSVLMYLLATLWIWNAVAYHALLFTRINPAAWLFAALFTIEGVLLFRAAARSWLEALSLTGPMSGLGIALACYALAYPLLSFGIGHRYPEIPTFGVPCPTAILTIGLLLGVRGGPPLSIAVIPAVWAFIGGSAALLFGVWTDYMLLAGGASLTGYLVMSRVIKPMGAFVSWQLLRAVRRRAERNAVAPLGSRRLWRSVRATTDERARAMPGDERIPRAIDTLTHGVTIRRPPRDVWPWLVQMGAGSRGGWYSYDWLDNGRKPSASRIVPELQRPALGTIFPALPGVAEGFALMALEHERILMLGWPAPDGTPEVTWTFLLDELAPGVTRLLVRVRGGPGYRFPGLPLLLTRLVVRVVHFIMQRQQLHGVARRAEATVSDRSAFKTPEGEAAYLAAYDAAIKLWPVSYEEVEIPSRFGMTHVVVTGPKDARPLVLLHGYWATSTMWSPNIADFSKEYRVYAIDVMGQPSKSLPDEPIRDSADYVTWLTATLDALHLDRVSLVGMSFGGWLALSYAVAAPQRLQKLVLLSPGGLLPIPGQFGLRGMLMVFFPTRLTVNSFMRWLGFTNRPGETDTRPVLELMYLGAKHFRVPVETSRVMPVTFSDDQLRSMRVPTLLLMGDHEVICDPVTALARARRLFPEVQGELVPHSSHDMCVSQHRVVDAQVLDFLSRKRTDHGQIAERSVA